MLSRSLYRQLLLALGLVCVARSQVQNANRAGAYTVLVYDENWDYMADRLQAIDWSDRLKHLRLGNDSFFSLGGEVRERGEYFDHANFGAAHPDSGFLLQRYMLDGDLHLGDRLRVFVQLKSGLEEGRDGGPRPGIDVDRLDFNQAFFDFTPWSDDGNSIAVRVGRQMMTYGAGRLVAVGAGLNVEQVFDGVRATLNAQGWRVDLFATRPTMIESGIFDDAPDHTQSFWGVYTTHLFPLLPRASIDLYYLGLDRKDASWNRGVGREQRETLGTRVSARSPTWYYDWEFTYQFGSFGNDTIRAWGIGTNTGYRFPDVRFTPRVELDAGALSGDHSSNHATLGTFNALFPNGSFLGQALLIGPYNVIIVRPKLELDLTKKIVLNPNLEFLWRESTTDGIYGPVGNLTHEAGSSNARFIGSQADLGLDYLIDRHTKFSVDFIHFFPGEFLKQTPPGKSVNFVSPQILYTF